MLSDVGRVVEEQAAQTMVSPTFGNKPVDSLLCMGIRSTVAQSLALMIHIPHVAIGIGHGNLQLGAFLDELQHKSTHREHTTGNDGATRIDKGTITENHGVILQHTVSNGTLLGGTKIGKVTPASLSIVNICLHLSQRHLSNLRQLTQRVCLLQGFVGFFIALHVVQIARTMTAIVTDIERLIALGSWCLRGQIFIRIDAVIASSKTAVTLDDRECRLCHARHGAQQQ